MQKLCFPGFQVGFLLLNGSSCRKFCATLKMVSAPGPIFFKEAILPLAVLPDFEQPQIIGDFFINSASMTSTETINDK
jgi:hypothetical protein